MGATHVREFAPAPPRARSDLLLHVIYTTPGATRAALRAAGVLAADLGAGVQLLVPKIVPYPLPLAEPATPASFTEHAVRELFDECEVEASAKVLLCRDREVTIPQWLPPECIAVIGRERKWGHGSVRRLIHTLKRSGHHIVVVDADRWKPAAAPLYARRIAR
jgi:hypothetical protein